jgi:hypothetical protein
MDDYALKASAWMNMHVTDCYMMELCLIWERSCMDLGMVKWGMEVAGCWSE